MYTENVFMERIVYNYKVGEGQVTRKNISMLILRESKKRWFELPKYTNGCQSSTRRSTVTSVSINLGMHIENMPQIINLLRKNLERVKRLTG